MCLPWSSALSERRLRHEQRSRARSPAALVIHLPPLEALHSGHAIGELGKLAWDEAIGTGVTVDGDFEIINSAMTAERALWVHRMGQALGDGARDRRVAKKVRGKDGNQMARARASEARPAKPRRRTAGTS
jgi:hypothetical protein